MHAFPPVHRKHSIEDFDTQLFTSNNIDTYDYYIGYTAASALGNAYNRTTGSITGIETFESKLLEHCDLQPIITKMYINDLMNEWHIYAQKVMAGAPTGHNSIPASMPNVVENIVIKEQVDFDTIIFYVYNRFTQAITRFIANKNKLTIAADTNSTLRWATLIWECFTESAINDNDKWVAFFRDFSKKDATNLFPLLL